MKTALISTLLALSSSFATAKTIEVTVTAEKAVEPDIIAMNAEVWSKAATAQRAQALAADKMKEVTAALDQFKIKKEDVQTLFFTFGPEYVWEGQRNRLVGFASTQTLRITLRRTDQSGKMIDSLTLAAKGGSSPKAESGVNVNSIQWDSSKRDEIETAALADGIKLAREKADQMAKAAGVRITGVRRLSHGAPTGEMSPLPRRFGKAEVAMAVAETSMAAGQVTVKVQVTAEYEIAP